MHTSGVPFPILSLSLSRTTSDRNLEGSGECNGGRPRGLHRAHLRRPTDVRRAISSYLPPLSASPLHGCSPLPNPPPPSHNLCSSHIGILSPPLHPLSSMLCTVTIAPLGLAVPPEGVCVRAKATVLAMPLVNIFSIGGITAAGWLHSEIHHMAHVRGTIDQKSEDPSK